MTFEDWFGTGHRLDDHDKQVAELMRMAWNMADKAARNECMEDCLRISRDYAKDDSREAAIAANYCASPIREKIK